MPQNFKMGGFGAWLQHAKPGEHYWVEGQNPNSVSGTATKYGKRIETRTYYAIHPGSMETVALVRAVMVEDKHGK